jgi:hypothetical protein
MAGGGITGLGEDVTPLYWCNAGILAGLGKILLWTGVLAIEARSCAENAAETGVGRTFGISK